MEKNYRQLYKRRQISIQNKGVLIRALTESRQVGVRRVSRDHLRHNAATAAPCNCINGSGWGGLGLGGVGGDGEEVCEVCEEIHCVIVGGVRFDRCDELF